MRQRIAQRIRHAPPFASSCGSRDRVVASHANRSPVALRPRASRLRGRRAGIMPTRECVRRETAYCCVTIGNSLSLHSLSMGDEERKLICFLQRKTLFKSSHCYRCACTYWKRRAAG